MTGLEELKGAQTTVSKKIDTCQKDSRSVQNKMMSGNLSVDLVSKELICVAQTLEDVGQKLFQSEDADAVRASSKLSRSAENLIGHWSLVDSEAHKAEENIKLSYRRDWISAVIGWFVESAEQTALKANQLKLANKISTMIEPVVRDVKRTLTFDVAMKWKKEEEKKCNCIVDIRVEDPDSRAHRDAMRMQAQIIEKLKPPPRRKY